MGEGPRRRRAKAWAGMYLALFNSDEDSANTETESTDKAGGSPPEPPDETETR